MAPNQYQPNSVITPQSSEPTVPNPFNQPQPAPMSPKKSKKRLLLVILLLVLIAGGAAAYLFLNKPSSSSQNKPPATVAKKQTVILSAAQPQFDTKDTAVGYLKINTSKFKEQPLDQTAKFDLSKLNLDAKKVNTAIFTGKILSFDQAGLYSYDLVNNKAYRLTDGGGSPRIMSDHFLVYAWSKQETTDVSYKINLLNLQTGETQTLKSGTSRTMALSSCCAVSSDGFKLAIPETNKIEVWDIRTGSSTSYPVTLQTFDQNFPTDDAFFKGAPYYSADEYPTPVWLENDHIMYADASPAKVVDADGNRKPTDNNVFILDTTSGKSAQIKAPPDGVDEFDPANQGKEVIVTAGAFYIYKLDLTGQSAPTQIGTTLGFDTVSPDGSKVYVMDATQSPQTEYYVNLSDLKTNTVDMSAGLSNLTQALPDGWIDDHDMLVKLTGTSGGKTLEYEAVYDTSADKVVEYVQIQND